MAEHVLVDHLVSFYSIFHPNLFAGPYKAQSAESVEKFSQKLF
jgi:hypothetical protein